MDRILAMALVGAWPGNVFGPGMSAAALETFNRDVRAKAFRNSSGGGGAAGAAAAGGGTRSASSSTARTTSAAGSGCGGRKRCAAAGQRTGEKEANSNGASANLMRRSSCPVPAALDLDQRLYFADAVVAPY